MHATILQAKAPELNVSEFSGDAGWLNRFNRRHNIMYNKIYGEPARANMETAMNWVKLTLVPIHMKCDDNNVFLLSWTCSFSKLLQKGSTINS